MSAILHPEDNEQKTRASGCEDHDAKPVELTWPLEKLGRWLNA